MSGAYVAKPAAAVVGPSPTPPPGWNPNWPFPGPYPPGYLPEFTLPMTATEVITPLEAADITGEFRDHVDFLTNEPDAIIFTAVIATSPARAIELRFSGDTEYTDSISSDSTLGDFWSVISSIEFKLTRSDEGGVVTLTGTSAIDGTTVVGTVDISIYQYIYSLNLSGPAGMSYDDTASVTATIRDHGTLPTRNPGSIITWTATVDGNTVGLRFSGDPGYNNSVESEYGDVGIYAGAEEDLEFDLTVENNGDTVVVEIESIAFGETLTTTLNILIGDPYAIVKCTMTGYMGQHEAHMGAEHFPYPENPHVHTNYWGLSLHFYGSAAHGGTPSGHVYHSFYNASLPLTYEEKWSFHHNARPTDPTTDFQIKAPVADGFPLLGPLIDGATGLPYPRDWLIGECNGNQIEIRCNKFKPYWVLPWVPMTYTVSYSFYKNWSEGNTTYDLTFEMYNAADELEDTWTKQIILAHNDGDTSWLPRVTWLTINGSTREVTVVNP